jgi:hypothetical protein
VDAFYLTVLVLSGVAVSWFAGFAAYRLYKGQG